MNETQVVNTASVLTAYVNGRADGFKAGVIFCTGALILYKAVRENYKVRHPQWFRSTQR